MLHTKWWCLFARNCHT